MELDFRTLTLFHLVLLIPACLVFALVAGQYRRHRGVWCWFYGCLLIAIGYGLRWWQHGMPVSYWWPGACFVFGNLLLWLGVYRFAGLRTRWRPLWLFPAIGVLWLLALSLPYSYQVWTALTLAGLPNLLVFLLLQRADHLGTTPIRTFVGTVFLCAALVLWLRAGAGLLALDQQWPIAVERLSTYGMLPSTAFIALRCFGLLVLLHSRQEQELAQLAVTDPLTGLPNRKGFLDQASRLLERQSPASRNTVLMLDLDHFKQINDQYGHASGDAVLRRFASILRDHLRPGDSCGRLGGEEFAALLLDTDSDTAAAVAERLRSCWQQQTVSVGRHRINASVSIGIGERQHSDEHIEALLQRADQALYAAKNDGRNRVSIAAPARADDRADNSAT